MSTLIDKNDVKAIVDALPDSATWDDLLEELEFRRGLERGLEDAKAGRVVEVSMLRAKYGLSA